MTLLSFSMTFMTYVSFHDIPGLENSLTKFYDFPRPGGGGTLIMPPASLNWWKHKKVNCITPFYASICNYTFT